MKKYLAIAGIVALAAGLSSTYTPPQNEENQTEYILQGAKKATIVDGVGSVGGIVVHEYSIIEAVSVKLSNTQLTEIKKLNPMIRSFKGQDVNVSNAINSFSSDNVSFNVKRKTATWTGVNSSSNSVKINAIDLDMPSVNKKIKWVKVNGVKLNTKNIKFSDSIPLQANEQFEIGAGQAINVKVKFKKMNSVSANDYKVAFGEIVQTSSASYSDKVAGKVLFNADANQVSWRVANTSDYTREIETIKVNYPAGNSAITQLSINGVFAEYNIDSNNDLVLNAPIELKNNNWLDVKVDFKTLSSADSEAYELFVHYTDGIAENVITPANMKAQGKNRDTHYPTLVRANLAHQRGITGYGVTVAILDTGIRDLSEIKKTATAGNRDITIVDVLGTSKNKGQAKRNDFNGHGTHLASIITNSSPSIDENGNATGSYNGIAPDVNLVVLKAFDEEGQSSYTDIIAALEYVVENKDVLNIKVLNLSFSAIPSSYYWDDPLNQALMKAWDAGITVIAAAGNRGPEAMTIGVPGNTPYVITVGAVSDNYTPDNFNDDFVTTFSSAGPTYEGFVKPEVVAPGGHIQGVMDKKTLIRQTYSIFNDTDMNDHDYFEMSGSSQSTAVTAGIVALMLQANPNLSPDDIKCRLIDTARTAATDDGKMVFSIFQQGAGLVDAMAAIESTATGCGNQGLSIAQDLSGEAHFIGPARSHENNGDFYIEGIDGLEWSGVYSDSQLWRNRTFDVDSQLWRNRTFDVDSQLWRNRTFDVDSQLWRNRTFDVDSQLWRNRTFDVDSQLWRNRTFDVDSQLWRNRTFDVDSQLWRNRTFDVDSQSFGSDSIVRDWVVHE